MAIKSKLDGQVEDELDAAESASIKDYITESGNIAALHNQISSCDGILARMEGLLTAFQTDLGSISSEILSLQQQSVEMNLRFLSASLDFYKEIIYPFMLAFYIFCGFVGIQRIQNLFRIC